jgi:hypothetical protein
MHNLSPMPPNSALIRQLSLVVSAGSTETDAVLEFPTCFQCSGAPWYTVICREWQSCRCSQCTIDRARSDIVSCRAALRRISRQEFSQQRPHAGCN